MKKSINTDPYAEGERLHWIALARKRGRGRPRKNAPPLPPIAASPKVKRPGFFWAKQGRGSARMVFVDHAGLVWKVQADESMNERYIELLPIPLPE